MKMMIMITSILTYFMIITSHLLLMMILISSTTFMICLIVSLSIMNSWFSFILFLIFMGGLMVLFVYISSLASNESFKVNTKNFYMKNFTISMMIFFIMTYINNNQSIKFFQMNIKEMIFKLYSLEMVSLIIMTMIYLLLVLIVIVNITSLHSGSLRPLC